MSTWLAVRVIGTFLLLITVFFFVLTYDPILEGHRHRRRPRALVGAAQLRRAERWNQPPSAASRAPHPHHHGLGQLRGGRRRPACSGAVPTKHLHGGGVRLPVHRGARAPSAPCSASSPSRSSTSSASGALFLIGLFFHEIFHDTHVYVAQALVVCVAVALVAVLGDAVRRCACALIRYAFSSCWSSTCSARTTPGNRWRRRTRSGRCCQRPRSACGCPSSPPTSAWSHATSLFIDRRAQPDGDLLRSAQSLS